MSPNPRSNKFAVHFFCKIVPHFVTHIRIASLILLCVSLSACGVSTSNPAKSITSTPPSSPNSANPTVSVSPGTASVPSSGQQQFTAIVTNTSNTAVTWSASQGAVTQSGLFTAPAVTTAPGRNRNRRLRLLSQCAGSDEYHSCANGGEHGKPSHDYDGNFGKCDGDSNLLANAISRRRHAAVFMEHHFGELARGNPTQ